MRSLDYSALKKRFRSPATLALFGAFAAPEPAGVIIVLCAALWWLRSRKRLALFRSLSGLRARIGRAALWSRTLRIQRQSRTLN